MGGNVFMYAGEAQALLEQQFDRKLWILQMGGEAWVMRSLDGKMICPLKGTGQSKGSWVRWCQRFRLLDTIPSKSRYCAV